MMVSNQGLIPERSAAMSTLISEYNSSRCNDQLMQFVVKWTKLIFVVNAPITCNMFREHVCFQIMCILTLLTTMFAHEGGLFVGGG